MSADKCPKPEEKNVYGTNADGTPYTPKPRGLGPQKKRSAPNLYSLERGISSAELMAGYVLDTYRDADMTLVGLWDRLPEKPTAEWFDKLVAEGSPEEKYVARDAVFSDPDCAERVWELVSDPMPWVSRTYGDRTRELIGIAWEMHERAGKFTPDELRQSDEELILARLGMTPPEKEAHVWELFTGDVDDHTYRWMLSVTALNLMRSCVKWIDWWAWEPVTPREFPCRRKD